MASGNLSGEYAPGVRFRTVVNGYGDHWATEYRGTEAALIAAGIVDESHFPGKPGRNKVSVTTGNGDGSVRVERAGANVYRVWRRCTPKPSDRARAKQTIHDASRPPQSVANALTMLGATPSPIAARISACAGLLAAAARDIGPKVGDSSKLARALEDIQQAQLAMEAVATELAASAR